ncbi:hypothetical protein [Gordonia sp. C13]|nr:hypothetical protein C5O27_16355 [Gordonia alkanivorans]MCK8616684.1 hypothetical protein [Gordonia sp. C13]
MTADDQTTRDQAIRTAYRAQANVRLEAAADRLRAVEAKASSPNPAKRAGCSNNAACVSSSPGQWECRDCRQITG